MAAKSMKISQSDHNQQTKQDLIAENVALHERIAELEAERSRQNEQQVYLSTLHEAALTLMHRLELNDLLQIILERAAVLAGTEHGYLMLVNRETGTVDSRLKIGAFTNYQPQNLKPGVGLGGVVWTTGEPVILESYYTWDKRLTYSPPDGPAGGVAALPLKSGDDFVGMIALAYGERGQIFTEDVLRILNGFADLASIALDNARLYNDVKQSQHFINRVTSAVPSLIYMHDVIEDKNIYYNDGMSDLLGYPQETIKSLEGRFMSSLMHPDDYANTKKLIEEVRHGDLGIHLDTGLRFDMRLKHADGTWRWFQNRTVVFSRTADGRVHQVLGAAQDIHDAKQTEENLRASEARFRTLVETIPAIVFIIYRGGGAYVNPAYEQITGYTGDTIRTSGVNALLHPDSRADVRDIITSFRERGEAPASREVKIITRDGRERWLDMRLSVIPMNDDVALFGVALDVTEARNITEQAMALKLEKERVRLLADFVRDAGHDFRTPLSTINTSLYLIERAEKAELREKHLNILREQISHIDRLVNGLLTMSRLDSESAFSLAPVDVERLLMEITPDIEARARENGLHFKMVSRLQEAFVLVDRTEFYRALMQFITNAVQYTHPGGRIALEIGGDRDTVCVTIADTGIGISEENLPHIFDRFFRADSSRSTVGLGLGLAIAQKIIERHHGEITVTSQLGEGSIFNICLPRHHPRR